MDSEPAPDDRSIRSLGRGIEILRQINLLGPIGLSDLVAATRFPHSTVLRLVRALQAEGLVRRIEGSKRYAPTERVLALSCGFTRDDTLTACAAAPIRALTAKIGWPVALLTRAGGWMMVRDSTVRETSMTFNVYDPGVTVPILGSAAGHAYLAFAGADERAEILRNAAFAGEPNIGGPTQTFADIREQGFAALPIVATDARLKGNAAIAAPLLEAGLVRGALSLVFFNRALPMAKAIERLSGPLIATARRIESELASAATSKTSRAIPIWQG